MKIKTSFFIMFFLFQAYNLNSMIHMDLSSDDESSSAYDSEETDSTTQAFQQIIDYINNEESEALDKYMSNLNFTTDQMNEILSKLDDEGYNPLFVAINNGAYDCAQVLINRGSTLNSICNGLSPLMMAINKILQLDKALSNSLTILIVYSSKEQLLLDRIKNRITEEDRLKKYKEFINQKNDEAKTALYYAILRNHDSAIKLLIQEGAEIDNVIIMDLIIKRKKYKKLLPVILTLNEKDREIFLYNLQKCLKKYLNDNLIKDNDDHNEKIAQYVNEIFMNFINNASTNKSFYKLLITREIGNKS